MGRHTDRVKNHVRVDVRARFRAVRVEVRVRDHVRADVRARFRPVRVTVRVNISGKGRGKGKV